MLFLAYEFSCLGSLKLCYLYIFSFLREYIQTSIIDKLYFMITFHSNIDHTDVNKSIKVTSKLKDK